MKQLLFRLIIRVLETQANNGSDKDLKSKRFQTDSGPASGVESSLMMPGGSLPKEITAWFAERREISRAC
jgi:hypothetical protein